MWLKKWTKIERWFSIDVDDFYKKFLEYRSKRWYSILSAAREIGISPWTIHNILGWQKIDPKTYKKLNDVIEIKLM